MIVYPDLYEERRHLVRAEPFLLIKGRLQRRDGIINVIAGKVYPLDQARAVFSRPTKPTGPSVRQIDVLAAKQRSEPRDKSITDLRTIAPAAHNYR